MGRYLAGRLCFVPFTEQAARNSLHIACDESGISVGSIHLIRLGTNAVFRIDDALIGRVSRDLTFVDNASKQIAVARWLERVGYPAVRAVDVPQPVTTDSHVVTFWKSVARETVYAPIADVASLIRQLHDLPAPGGVELPVLRPFGEPDGRLPRLTGLTDDDRRFLHGRIEWARASFPRLPFVLPLGVIHGDANVGNVLTDADGRAVLIDLDSLPAAG
jgi:hypothetical protein